MGTITPRQRKDGSTAHLAQVVIKRGGRIEHRENRTFDRRQAAAAWLEKREKELAQPGALERLKGGDPRLSDVIDTYTNENKKKIGKTKAQVLRAIKDFRIADKRCSEIGSEDIVQFAKEKLETGVQPQTVGNYLSHLSSIFAIARPAWKYDLDPQAMDDAWKVVKKLGLASRSKSRDRRPTVDEMTRIVEHFSERRRRSPQAIPMAAITVFAMFSTRRLSEIGRIRWADLDEAGAKVLVRDMKNPGVKEGNDVWCNLPEPALRIVDAMPRKDERIFPFNTDSIEANFVRCCYYLGINTKDTPEELRLKFHDLRHEGVSRLFEIDGKDIPRIATVSGHRSWLSLQRYTHLRQTGDKWAKWPWIDKIIEDLHAREERYKR